MVNSAGPASMKRLNGTVMGSQDSVFGAANSVLVITDILICPCWDRGRFGVRCLEGIPEPAPPDFAIPARPRR